MLFLFVNHRLIRRAARIAMHAVSLGITAFEQKRRMAFFLATDYKKRRGNEVKMLAL